MRFTNKVCGLKLYKPEDRALPKDMYHLKKGNLTFLVLAPQPPSSWYSLIACHDKLVRPTGDWGKVIDAQSLSKRAKLEVLQRVGDWQVVHELIRRWASTFND